MCIGSFQHMKYCLPAMPPPFFDMRFAYLYFFFNQAILPDCHVGCDSVLSVV